MTSSEERLLELEAEMNALVGLRNQRVTVGQAMIDSANRDFDERAIPLGRQINQLRAQIESEKPSTPNTVIRTVRESHNPDPEWSQEDIDHFKELRRREAHNARNTTRSRTA